MSTGRAMLAAMVIGCMLGFGHTQSQAQARKAAECVIRGLFAPPGHRYVAGTLHFGAAHAIVVDDQGNDLPHERWWGGKVTDSEGAKLVTLRLEEKDALATNLLRARKKRVLMLVVADKHELSAADIVAVLEIGACRVEL